MPVKKLCSTPTLSSSNNSILKSFFQNNTVIIPVFKTFLKSQFILFANIEISCGGALVFSSNKLRALAIKIKPKARFSNKKNDKKRFISNKTIRNSKEMD